MWMQLIFFIVIIQVSLHLFKCKGDKKRTGENSAVLGTLDMIKPLISSVIYGPKPNYEVGLEVAKKYPKFFLVFFPFQRSGLGGITDLSLAKSIMNSSKWINKIWDNHYITDATFKKPQGLLFGNGDYWKEARKLCITILRQLDFFKPNSMEKFITEEVQHMEKQLNDKITLAGGEIMQCTYHMFEAHALNIVAQVIIGRRFEDGDPVVEQIFSTMNVANREFNLGSSAVDVFPWLRYIPGLTFLGSAIRASNTIYVYFRKELERRREKGVYRTNPKDFTDYFMLEIDRRAGDTPSYITDECFLSCMRDMIFAGSDTTSSALEHGILHMALNPRIQKKLQDEIDTIIGTSRYPSYNDNMKMPYTQAVMHEILRLGSPVPVTAHAPVSDAEIEGIDVPKGTMMGINIYAIHRSADLWHDPDVFQPERFLDNAGNIVNTDKIIPFGYGKRLCIGQSMAQVSLFLIFVTLMQRYEFQLSDQHPPPSLANVVGLSRCPIPYHVRIRPRVVVRTVHKQNEI